MLALGVDPFTQQIFTFPVRNVINDTASIPIAKGFEGRALGLSDALARGLYAPELQVNFHCPSGRCSFPSFDTLGVCFTCADVSEATEADCFQNSTNVTTCSYTSPRGSQSSAVGFDINFLNRIFNSSTMLPWGYPGIPDAWPAILNTGPLGELMNLTVFRFDDSPNISNMYHHVSTSPKVFECSVQWCIEHHSHTNVVSGQLKDMPTSWEPVRLDFQGCMSVERPHDTTYATCPAVPMSQDFPSNTTDAGLTHSKLGHTLDLHWINQEDTSALIHDLMENLEFELSQGASDDPDTALHNSLYSHNDGNFTTTLRQMTTSLTNAIRMGPNTTTVTGDSYAPEVFIQVNWAWFTYPAALTLLATSFLLVSIVLSTKRHNLVWKSSSLALLFHGLHGWDKDDLDARHLRTMESKAYGMAAHLGQTEAGNLALLKG